MELPRRQKRALLDGLRRELEERFPEGASQEALLSQVGQPAETAFSMLDGVQQREQRRYQTVRRRRIGCVIAVLALLLAASVGIWLYYGNTLMGRIKTTIVEDSVPVNYSNYSVGAFDTVSIDGN